MKPATVILSWRPRPYHPGLDRTPPDLRAILLLALSRIPLHPPDPPHSRPLIAAQLGSPARQRADLRPAGQGLTRRSGGPGSPASRRLRDIPEPPEPPPRLGLARPASGRAADPLLLGARPRSASDPAAGLSNFLCAFPAPRPPSRLSLPGPLGALSTSGPERNREPREQPRGGSEAKGFCGEGDRRSGLPRPRAGDSGCGVYLLPPGRPHRELEPGPLRPRSQPSRAREIRSLLGSAARRVSGGAGRAGRRIVRRRFRVLKVPEAVLCGCNPLAPMR